MAANEQNRPFEPATPGGTSAGGGAASAFERPVPPSLGEEPEVSITPPAPDVTAYAPAMRRSRLISVSRSTGHYTGKVVGMFRRAQRGERRQGIRERAETMVREHPSVLAGAAALGFVAGRVLKGR